MNYIRLLIIGLIALSVVIGCGPSAGTTDNSLISNPYKRTEFLMGTVVTVKVFDEDKEAALEPAFERTFSLAEQLTANEEGSEVDKVNESAGKKAVPVSNGMYELIDSGIKHSSKVNGDFDISIGPLTSLWRIGFDDARKPDQAEIDAVLPLIDYQQIELNEEDQTVFLKNEHMKLDLGAIAKGYIADEIAIVLKEQGVTTAIIDLGGNIYVMGNNTSGDPWTVGIQNPFLARGEVVGKLRATDKSIVTSGIYERFLEVDGEEYHHLLNPKDGYPITNDIAGISIISDQSLDGDALSTSVFSKGIEDGMKFVETLNGVEAIFISHNQKVHTTTGLIGEFELTNDEFELVE